MVSDGPILPNRAVHVILSFTLPFFVSPPIFQIHRWGYQKHISLEFDFDFFSYFRNVASREICFSFLFLKGYYDQVSDCHFSLRVSDLNQGSLNPVFQSAETVSPGSVREMPITELHPRPTEWKAGGGARQPLSSQVVQVIWWTLRFEKQWPGSLLLKVKCV